MATIHQGTIDFYKKSFINYINDYNEKHLLTDFTKNECIELIESTTTIDEFELLANKLEKIIENESARIKEECSNLALMFDKEKYFEYLKEHIYLLQNYKITVNKEIVLKILLNPMNEEELEYANKYITFIEDMGSIKYSQMKDLDYDNSLYLNHIINKYNALMNGKDYNDEKIDSVELLAKAFYEVVYIGSNGTYELKEAFRRKTNIDLDDDLESMRFDYCMNDSSKEINDTKDNPKFEISKDIKFFDEFHKIYLDNQITKER